jgi:hypothetical protein
LLTSTAATDVEGIFRLSGSEKRIKELRNAFNSPDRYGKGLDWTGYTVHDAANILRRYFNQLPEPIIPLEFYDQFRDPLRNHQLQAVGRSETQNIAQGNFDQDGTIRLYQNLITQLPPLNRQLLLYILDLLAVFASKSDLNKMTTANLAAIFQPGILSHPAHDMAVAEYHLSQDVLIFLIENQDHFLIGMPGTAVDTQTVEEVESGPPTPANNLAAPQAERSNSSSGKNGAGMAIPGVRRSVSASSRKSKGSGGGASPVTPTMANVAGIVTTGAIASGVHRSNTLPTRSPILTSSANRFGGSNQAIKENDEVTTQSKEAAGLGIGDSNNLMVNPSIQGKHLGVGKENMPVTAVSTGTNRQIPGALSSLPQRRSQVHQAVLSEVMSPTENMQSLPDSGMGPAPQKASGNMPTHPTSIPYPNAAGQSFQGPQAVPSGSTTPTMSSAQGQGSKSGPGAALAALFGSRSQEAKAPAPAPAPAEETVLPMGSPVTGAADLKKKPNKLQKQRPKDKDIGNPSAHSSTGSLSEQAMVAGGMPMAGTGASGTPSMTTTTTRQSADAFVVNPGAGPALPSPQQPPVDYLTAAPIPIPGQLPKAGMSPGMGSISVASKENSDVDEIGGSDMFGTSVDEKSGLAPKRKGWFASRRRDEVGSSQQPQPQTQPYTSTTGAVPQTTLGVGSNGQAGTSRSSMVTTSEGRRSFAMDRVTSDSEAERDPLGTSVGSKRDPISWMKGKIREGRDRLRVQSPTRQPGEGYGSVPLDQAGLPIENTGDRPRSFEVIRPQGVAQGEVLGTAPTGDVSRMDFAEASQPEGHIPAVEGSKVGEKVVGST